MIFTERTIRVSNGTSSISSPIILYKGDKNIKIRFKIVDCPYTYSKNVDNIIETSEASYAQLIIKTPNNGIPILSDVAEPENGYVTFIITGEMIDEVKEVGKYSLQVRLLDDEQYGRITIPEVVDGIEVREPMVTEGVSTTNEVDVAVVDYAVTTAGVSEDAFDSGGNYIETNWQSGNVITSAKLNKIEKGITGVNSQIKDITSRIDSITIGGINTRDVEENETFILAINGSTSETVEMILSTYNVSVNENGSATFTIKLNKQPNGNKVVNLTLNNAYCTVSPSTLTFTNDNYNTDQTVTITGIHDSKSYENKNSILTVQSDNSTSKTIAINILNIDENSGGSTATANARFRFDYTNYDGSTTYTNNGITATINKSNLQNNENGVYFENAYLDIPYSQELVKTPYTLEITVKKDNNVTNSNYYIIDNRYATGSGNGYAIGQFYDSSTVSHKNEVAIVGALGYGAKAFDGSLIDGNEHTVKFIYTGSQIKSYLDGTLKSTNNMSFAPLRGFLVMALNYDSYFNGYLKHFIIYDGEVE